LPFVLLTAGIVWQLANNERETRREAILFSTRTLMNAVDTVLSKQIAVGQMLATSPALQSDDMAAFRQEAERTAQGLGGGWIVLSDENGQQLVNLKLPVGAPLPIRQGVELGRRTIKSGRVQVSDVFAGAVLKSPIITVEVPVLRQSKPPLCISIVMEPSIFLALFEQWNLPDGWLAGLIDSKGNFIARSRNHAEYVGKPASEDFRAAAQREPVGWNEMTSVDGMSVANAHVTSPLSGWVMGLAAERTVFEAPIHQTVLVAGLAGAATLLLSLLLAMWSARRIARPIEQIEQGTHALMLRRAITFSSTGLPEADRTLDALASTARVFAEHDRERDEREAHVRLIMRELSHRSKNLLAIAADLEAHDLVHRFRVAVQLPHPGAGRRPRPPGRAAVERRLPGRSGARAAHRVRHRTGGHPRRADHVAHRGRAERGACVARACHQRFEIRRAVVAGRQGQHRLDAAGGDGTG
jgi:hypothetical protein